MDEVILEQKKSRETRLRDKGLFVRSNGFELRVRIKWTAIRDKKNAKAFLAGNNVSLGTEGRKSIQSTGILSVWLIDELYEKY